MHYRAGVIFVTVTRREGEMPSQLQRNIAVYIVVHTWKLDGGVVCTVGLISAVHRAGGGFLYETAH